MKRLVFPFSILLLLLCLYACSDDAPDKQDVLTPEAPSETVDKSSLEPTEEIEPEVDLPGPLLMQFFEDADVPEAVRGLFAMAVSGDKESQELVFQYCQQHDDLTWQVRGIVYRHAYESDENECLFRIAMLYYYGDDNIHFMQDRIKTIEWSTLSAEKGNVEAALFAGDMVRYGDGVPVDEQAAFAFYMMAHSIISNGYTCERLGDCYAGGIGTTADSEKAFGYYLASASMGNYEGLYKLADFRQYAEINMAALYKAASSRNYSGDYWAMVDKGLDGYSAGYYKTDLVSKLLDIWNSGDDPAALSMKESLCSDDEFPGTFVEALVQVVYTYSYHAFAEEYGLRPNRTDGTIIQFVPVEDDKRNFASERIAELYLERDGFQFYEYDFDNCGENEIGVSLRNGSGGDFMSDSFGIYKKNKDGLYEYLATGPGYTLRDGMRIIRYGGKIYFIVNPFDDTGNAPHNIVAQTIDKNGNSHEISIIINDYFLQHIVTYTSEAYSDCYNGFSAEVEQQVHEAVTATKEQRVYSPENEEQLVYYGYDYWWDKTSGWHSEEVARQDVFAIADLDNTGVEIIIHKGRLIIPGWHYFDYNWFQIYESSDFNFDSLFVKAPFCYDYFSGKHSGGNIHNLMPLNGDVVQFWTHEYGGVTYCATLQRYGLLYALHVFKVHQGEVDLVSKSLYFDEAQNVDIAFSLLRVSWE